MKSFWRWFYLSSLAGVLAGIAAWIFLSSLKWVTDFREAHPILIWGLPAGGLLIGFVYHRFGKPVASGSQLIIEEIHEPQKVLPFRMAPFILFGTLITHLFGGSAGREGTAVQMGASLADQVAKFFSLAANERRSLLMAGAGAGFGAAIGAPWAGFIFGMALIHGGRLQLSAFFPCGLASFVAFFTAHFLGAPHLALPAFEMPNLHAEMVLWSAIVGVIFGLTARGFVAFTRWIEREMLRWVRVEWLRPMVMGFVLVAIFVFLGNDRYAGLGLSVIQEAMVKPLGLEDPFFKFFMTGLTVGSGFKGGEFVPLVFIGSTLGSALSQWVPLAAPLLARLGFAAVFAGAANTPLACTVMAMELFGIHIGPIAFLACCFSFLVSGSSGIYKKQRKSLAFRFK